PLRGILFCPECRKKLTGSASRGKMGVRYFYYHCKNGCKVRFSADMVNQQFEKQLNSISFDESSREIFETILEDLLNDNKDSRRARSQIVKEKIEIIKSRLSSLQDKFMDDLVSAEDYRELKSKYEKDILEQNKILSEIRVFSKNVVEQIKSAFEFVINLSNYYSSIDPEMKKIILSSTFPQGIFFQKIKFELKGLMR
ncbi:MAG: recombinase zinc beta ribbon domain-containing protein, partial [Bacteroidota bacterium]